MHLDRNGFSTGIFQAGFVGDGGIGCDMRKRRSQFFVILLVQARYRQAAQRIRAVAADLFGTAVDSTMLPAKLGMTMGAILSSNSSR
jgi:hypothetical protein